MAKSGQYMPHRSQPLHFSGATTCGGWYPFELKAEESARTLVGQNSTQKPQALQRSTMMETRPFATGPPRGVLGTPETRRNYRGSMSQQGVTWVTDAGESGHTGHGRLPARHWAFPAFFARYARPSATRKIAL